MKIRFKFSIENFFSKEEKYKNFFCFEKLVTKNKFLTFEGFYYSRSWLGCDFNWQPVGDDHAGLSTELAIFGFGISIDIRDKRHWDDYNWKWDDYTLDVTDWSDNGIEWDDV